MHEVTSLAKIESVHDNPRFQTINAMQHHGLKNVNNCLNTNIYSYLDTSGGQNSNLYLNVDHFFNTSVNWTSVAAEDCCFPAQVSIMHCSIGDSD